MIGNSINMFTQMIFFFFNALNKILERKKPKKVYSCPAVDFCVCQLSMSIFAYVKCKQRERPFDAKYLRFGNITVCTKSPYALFFLGAAG